MKFEAGRRCSTGDGLFMFSTREAEKISMRIRFGARTTSCFPGMQSAMAVPADSPTFSPNANNPIALQNTAAADTLTYATSEDVQQNIFLPHGHYRGGKIVPLYIIC